MPTTEYTERKFTRQEFYDLVWTTPIVTLSKELGCADFMLLKLCRDYDIPKPYHGYWTLKANGKAPDQTQLPENSDPTIQSLTFYQRPQRQSTINVAPRETLYDPDIRSLLAKASELGPIEVSDSLRKPHPLVVTWEATNAKKIANSKRHWKDQEHFEKREILDIHVSEKLTKRATLIMDALIKRIEKLGGKIVLKPSDHRLSNSKTLIFLAETEATQVRLRERTNMVRIKDPHAKVSWDRERTDNVPNGLLLFDAGAGSQSFDNWMPKDTKTIKLEGLLNNLILGCIRRVGDQRIRERERERAQLDRLEEETRKRQAALELQRKRDELKRLQDAEKAQIEELLDRVKGWKESQAIHDFMDAICQVHSLEDGAMPVRGEIADYLRWANEIADRFNPLRPKPPSILDKRIDY